MTKHRYFVTGTDTDIGKTLVSLVLLNAANSKGLSTVALKPVAAGCNNSGAGLRNQDALSLQYMMSADLTYSQVNPVALEPAIAPHIAAAQVNEHLEVVDLAKICHPVIEDDYDLVIMEGAGGWRVPLNPHQTMADLVKTLGLSVILVVGLRLGCINHGLLTAEAIQRDGLKIAAWVANQVDEEMPVVEENLATLAHRLDAPCLGYIPFLHKPEPVYASEYLDIDKLLG